GEVQSARFSTTFRTVDVAPTPVTSLAGAGYYPGARLSWTLPNITDLDQVIVRMATGSTPPSSITSGTGVYAGTGSSVTVSGVTAGTTYSFQVWVRDRSGKLSTGATLRLRLLATAQAISSSATTINYGGSVRVTGRLSRKDTGAVIAGASVQLYGRRKGSTSWVLLGTATSSSTGGLSFSHKPSWSLDYRWIYRGSPQFAGVVSANRAVSVRVVVSATLSKTSFARGGSVKLSGKVSPSHAGKTVYLQRYVGGKWTTVTSRKLSSTSSYSFTIKPSSRGTYKYRVYRPADTDHLSGVSSVRTFKVY
ncbi:MAG TPA: hypothetical protein VFX61_10635, partial [Micromonosporaceae bacterium]|nr:hypothetical protein [Micromonosporaceae bacterium]